jgi:hypothetical protein
VFRCQCCDLYCWDIYFRRSIYFRTPIQCHLSISGHPPIEEYLFQDSHLSKRSMYSVNVFRTSSVIYVVAAYHPVAIVLNLLAGVERKGWAVLQQQM